MRAPAGTHPRRRAVGTKFSKDELHELSGIVKYVGSPEHKDAPSFVGMPKARADASICDRVLGQNQVLVQKWLRTAVANGWVGELWEGRFPRYVWYCDGDVVYEGRLVNRQLGEYKGYPLDNGERPEGLKC